jgi:hypothetical protein
MPWLASGQGLGPVMSTPVKRSGLGYGETGGA